MPATDATLTMLPRRAAIMRGRKASPKGTASSSNCGDRFGRPSPGTRPLGPHAGEPGVGDAIGAADPEIGLVLAREASDKEVRTALGYIAGAPPTHTFTRNDSPRRIAVFTEFEMP